MDSTGNSHLRSSAVIGGAARSTRSATAGPAAVAIGTVGASEIQGGIFDHHLATTIGPGQRVAGRAIGAEVEGLPDEDLVDLVTDDTLRNGPCYRELDRRFGPSWGLLLIATDQPEEHPSDTIGIATAIARQFQIKRPGVEVRVEAVTARPDQASDQLGDQILACVRAMLAEWDAHRIVVLPVGATPAMRVLTERAAGIAAPAGGPLTRLVPEGGQALEGGLL